MAGMDYKSAGVDIELGDDASKVLYNAAKLTWQNRHGKLGEVVELFPDFTGLRAIHVGGLPKGTYLNMSFDGIGTKTELAERTRNHQTMAYDLFAMVCDDAVVRGGEPVLVGSILDVRSLGRLGDVSYTNFVKQLAVGYVGAAKDANVAVVNGEIAELGARVQGYGPFNYNWGAGIVWFGREDRLLSGKEVQEGDLLVGLREHGPRSNGLSLIRKVLRNAHGDEWHDAEYEGKNLGDLVLAPSRIYSRAVVEMFGGVSGEPKAVVHGVAHVTGGGIPGKLGRLLKPSGMGAEITDPFVPPAIMRYCQEKGGVEDREAYKAWNMGQGMIIATPRAEDVIAVAEAHGIEAKVIGEVVDDPGIRIRNRGLRSIERELVFA